MQMHRMGSSGPESTTGIHTVTLHTPMAAHHTVIHTNTVPQRRAKANTRLANTRASAEAVQLDGCEDEEHEQTPLDSCSHHANHAGPAGAPSGANHAAPAATRAGARAPSKKK